MAFLRINFDRRDQRFQFNAFLERRVDFLLAHMDLHRRNQGFYSDAFLQGGVDFFFVSRHLFAGTPVEKRHTGNIFLAQGDACSIHRRIAAADDAHMSTGQLIAPEVECFQKLNGRIDSFDIFIFQVQAPAFMRADGEKDRAEFIGKQVLQAHVFPQLPAVLYFDVAVEKCLDFLFHNIPGQPVSGQRTGQHAARHLFRFKDGHLVAQQR